MQSTWQRVWHVVGTQRILVILNHYFVISFTTVIHLEVGIDQSHRKREALANMGDASRNSWFSFSFCYPGLFGFDFEKWDLSYGDLGND